MLSFLVVNTPTFRKQTVQSVFHESISNVLVTKRFVQSQGEVAKRLMLSPKMIKEEARLQRLNERWRYSSESNGAFSGFNFLQEIYFGRSDQKGQKTISVLVTQS